MQQEVIHNQSFFLLITGKNIITHVNWFDFTKEVFSQSSIQVGRNEQDFCCPNYLYIGFSLESRILPEILIVDIISFLLTNAIKQNY